jgi:DNA-binding NarL/FixJ family response regulator
MVPTPIKVTIIEDDTAYRNSLATILKGTPGFQCGGTYTSAEEALSSMSGKPADVTLVDIRLPGLSGIEYVRAFKQAHPAAAVIMLTFVEDGDQIFQSLMAGANGYILKSTPPSSILDAIRETVEGGGPMSRVIARKVLQYFHRLPKPAAKLPSLTPRECEVLAQFATGQTLKEIGASLHLSQETVRTHVRSIYRKLNVHSRAAAVGKYLRRA